MLAEVVVPEIVSRWFHLASVIVAVGGTVFIRFVLHPSVGAALPGEAGQPLRELLFRRWARVMHGAILVIILSGTYNLIVQLPRHKAVPGGLLYHKLLGLKLLLALALFFIAIAVTGRGRLFEGLRKRRATWLAVNVVIAAVIVLISNMLKNLPGTG